MSEISSNTQDGEHATRTRKKTQNMGLLLMYSASAAAGAVGGPILQRLYYMHGGSLKWLTSLLQSIGFLILLPIVAFLYLKHLSKPKSTGGFFMDTRLFLSSAVIGVLIGLDNYFYSAGLSYLPLSTSSLLFSTQLAFTGFFAFFIVKQKFTFYIVNSVLVITFAAFVLALHTSSDRPAGVTKQKYLLGFFFTLGGAALWGMISPLIELAYSKSSKAITISILLQVQCAICAFAALFSIVGMAANKEFKIIPEEAREFDLGEGTYYLITVSSAILYQLSFLGVVGLISCMSSLFVGIFNSGLLPVIEIASVVTFHDKFTGEKALSLGLCLWGFSSYFLGEFRKTSQSKNKGEDIVEVGVVDRGDGECSTHEIEMGENGGRSKMQEV